MIINLEKEDFNKEVSKGKVLVDFHAAWCGPCKMMHPVLEGLAKSNPDLKIVKIDVDQHDDIARAYGVMSIPTLILFENGKLKEKNVGFTPKDRIESWLK